MNFNPISNLNRGLKQLRTGTPPTRLLYVARKRLTLRLKKPRWLTHEQFHLRVNYRDHITRTLWTWGVYESETRDKILDEISSGDTVLDIGSHVGTHTLTMRRAVGDAGRILAIEANKNNEEMLRETVERNGLDNIDIVNCAVSDEQGEVELYETGGNSGASTTSQPEETSTFTRRYVKKKTLETVLNEEGLDTIDFAKIDIEGEELNALRGLDDLRRVKTMILEVHRNILTDTELDELMSMLTDSGTLEKLNGEEVMDFGFTEDSNIAVIWRRADEP